MWIHQVGRAPSVRKWCPLAIEVSKQFDYKLLVWFQNCILMFQFHENRYPGLALLQEGRPQDPIHPPAHSPYPLPHSHPHHHQLAHPRRHHFQVAHHLKNLGYPTGSFRRRGFRRMLMYFGLGHGTRLKKRKKKLRRAIDTNKCLLWDVRGEGSGIGRSAAVIKLRMAGSRGRCPRFAARENR